MATKPTAAMIAMLTPGAEADEADEDMMNQMPEEGMEVSIDVEPEGFEVDLKTGDVTETDDEADAALAAVLDTIPFNANLAEYLSEEELKEIGCDIVEMVKSDLKSREPWFDTAKQGMKRLGLYSPEQITDTGISLVSHPLVIEAAVQFQARAMAELMPPGGPVKGALAGDETPEFAEQSRRVEKYMNYQLTVEDRDYYDERDQMYFMLPFTGSEFDKQYYDTVTKKVVSRWVRSDDFVVPYDSKGLTTAQRYTHVIHSSHNAYRRMVASGQYCECELGTPSDSEELRSPLTDTLTELSGEERPDMREEDREHTFYECHIEYDLPGFEREYALPYIITVDASSEQVLGIYRNWREDDETTQKRIWFTHKKFLPGFGFYGFGLLHCIGSLSDAATDILRILLDSGAFASLQGGFKSKDAKLKGDVTLKPGLWLDTEMTAEELTKSFYTPPFKEPSGVLFQLLGTLQDLGQRFAATTETMVGDSATTGPVGTMVAQIEQGSKVFSGIHRRLHKAQGDEFIHIADLNGEWLSDAYPYFVRGNQQMVLRQDFDRKVDIIPVSDPNIHSSAQRIAMAQSAMQMASQMPDISDRREAAIQMLTAMRFPEPEKVFPKVADAQRADPISEVAFILLGRPVKAYLDQSHQAHISVHTAHLQQMPQQYQGVLQAHISEHMAMAQFMQFMQMGVPLPPVNFDADKHNPMLPDLDAQTEMQISQAAAQAMQQLMQQQQQQQQQQDPAAAKAAAAQQAFQAAEARKDAAFQAAEARKQAQAAAAVDRKDALEGLDPQLVKQAQEYIDQAGLQMSARELALLSKTFGKPFNEIVEALSRMMMQGQGGSQFPQTAEMQTNAARFR